MAKSDLIAKAGELGIELSGKETVAELETLLEAHGQTAEQVQSEEAAAPDPAVEEAAQRIAEAQQAVTDAQTALGEAKAVHEASVAEHAKLTAPALPVVGTQFLVEGEKAARDLPTLEDGAYPRRIMIHGSSYEHVSETPGVDAEGNAAVAWVYRRM